MPIRLLLTVALPLAVQLAGFALVAQPSHEGRSFVGLLALGVAVLAVPATTVVNWTRARRLPPAPLARLLVTGMLFALVWPTLLMALRAAEG
jgi:hypothetical protein